MGEDLLDPLPIADSDLDLDRFQECTEGRHPGLDLAVVAQRLEQVREEDAGLAAGGDAVEQAGVGVEDPSEPGLPALLGGHQGPEHGPDPVVEAARRWARSHPGRWSSDFLRREDPGMVAVVVSGAAS